MCPPMPTRGKYLLVIKILGSNKELCLHPIGFSSLVKSPMGIKQNAVLVGKMEPM